MEDLNSNSKKIPSSLEKEQAEQKETFLGKQVSPKGEEELLKKAMLDWKKKGNLALADACADALDLIQKKKQSDLSEEKKDTPKGKSSRPNNTHEQKIKSIPISYMKNESVVSNKPVLQNLAKKNVYNKELGSQATKPFITLQFLFIIFTFFLLAELIIHSYGKI